jgi:hypothetical protein
MLWDERRVGIRLTNKQLPALPQAQVRPGATSPLTTVERLASYLSSTAGKATDPTAKLHEDGRTSRSRRMRPNESSRTDPGAFDLLHARSSDFDHIRSLGTLLSLNDFELHPVSLP